MQSYIFFIGFCYEIMDKIYKILPTNGTIKSVKIWIHYLFPLFLRTFVNDLKMSK